MRRAKRMVPEGRGLAVGADQDVSLVANRLADGVHHRHGV